MQSIVITGAAGRIGRTIAPLLEREGRRLVLLDHEVPADAAGEWVEASITDRDALAAAFAGADTVVHLAGIPVEDEWASILSTNIDGTHAVLSVAHEAGVRRVLLASTIHAAGYWTGSDLAEHPFEPRPDTLYGVSKATLEALGSVFADRFGMSIVSARICTFLEHPAVDAVPGRTIATWLSPADMVRLVEAVAALEEPGHHLVWAVSANAQDWFPLEAGRAIGFEPLDDAVQWFLDRDGRTPDLPSRDDLLAGGFVGDGHPLGERWG
ncbi:NAD-dependent epimerase/dehydratase family protein [Schumannella luteola]